MTRPATTTTTRAPSASSGELTDLALAGLAGLVVVAGVLRAGAHLAAVATGHQPPAGGLAGAVRVLSAPGDPSAAWGTPMPGPVLYWAVTVLLLVAAGALVALIWWWWRRDGRHRSRDPRRLPGTATRADVVAAAGARSVLRRAVHTRPNLSTPARVRPGEVGYLLGRSHGVSAWASVEDSMLLLGPPRSGKGLHLVIPFILDAPGAVVTTSTRPDNLTATLTVGRH